MPAGNDDLFDLQHGADLPMTSIRSYLDPQFKRSEPLPGCHVDNDAPRTWKVKAAPVLEVREWRWLYHGPPLYCFYEIWNKGVKIWESSHFQHPEAANKKLNKAIKALIDAKEGLFPDWLQE